MPWENVGNCGNGQMPGEERWIMQCYEMALSYLEHVLGDPPEGCELGVMWHEHELAEYPSVGVHWDFPHADPPWGYISRCEQLLAKFDEAINWSDINPAIVLKEIDDDLNEEADDDALWDTPDLPKQ